jgi:hypothetical protein
MSTLNLQEIGEAWIQQHVRTFAEGAYYVHRRGAY